jgi:hypothetical protein
MVKNKPGRNLKNQAQLDFLRGLTLKEIAEKYDMPYRTIKQWHWRDRWGDARKDLAVRVKETTINQLCQKIVENTKQHIEISFLACSAALETLTKVYNAGNSDIFSLLEIVERTAKIGLMTATIQNKIMPTASEAVVKHLLDDLEKLKALSQDEDCV